MQQANVTAQSGEQVMDSTRIQILASEVEEAPEVIQQLSSPAEKNLQRIGCNFRHQFSGVERSL